MTRRRLLSAFAALPFAGSLFSKPAERVEWHACEVTSGLGTRKTSVVCGTYRRIPAPDADLLMRQWTRTVEGREAAEGARLHAQILKDLEIEA